MKYTLTAVIILTLFIGFDMSKSKKSDTVEGILYTDGSAVSLGMDNGNIVEIKHLETDKNAKQIFVAPGLIDVQINGYMGVDFSGPGLTVEGVRKPAISP